ncbi:hypothetical protein AGDE_09630 [Angomonas deanei]|nr:hypothetical protein AGDE_09630 [Angomonas deanei]|eukprot:EPY30065.1 hypothetical protein AGDE_09630 [Angomonas deanei]
MDPSKRICLKNLPEKCTKRELAEFIRNRTGAQPHSIDLGLDSEGNIRRYAHFSCEGAKNVLEVLAGGAALRDSMVYAHSANPHYSFRYAEARRKREREDEEAEKQQKEFEEESRKRFLARTNGGVLTVKDGKKPPKSFYVLKQKYANIASEIAQKSREAHVVYQRDGVRPEKKPRYQRPVEEEAEETPAGERLNTYLRPPAVADTEPKPHDEAQKSGHAGRPTNDKYKNSHKSKKPHGKKVVKEKEVVAPPPPPPQPTKEERKLTGLQAKIEALKLKMQKK